ncbi:MAG: YqgE/AlgH family protein [Boseongicola sp.]|nr:YqgE/AlgH family protein [Boseongicola sp.]NNL18760.1 YqgE/AlgH family protein [Boseongicola sp.]
MSVERDVDPSQLEGKLLIAMPGMGDPRFDRSVIFMCAHSEDGALGLIVNKPTPELSFTNLLKQLEIEVPGVVRDVQVHFGGPVEGVRGFVLHSNDFVSEGSTLRVSDGFGMTATLDVMEALAGETGPRDALLALGYAGWGPGQLEAEILQNGWLTCDASRSLVFEEKDETKWTAALATLGVDALTLSADAGRA